MKQYLELLESTLYNGSQREDRTGTGTISQFGTSLRFNLQEGFPMLTTKRLNFKAIVYELLWFLRGDSNIKFLNDNGVHIWDAWADENGDLGPIYGVQWRKWRDYRDQSIDQLAKAIDLIKNDPYSRRIVVNAWNVGELEDMKLPPCHLFYQFYVKKRKLSMQMYMRSVDMFLGMPFDIASYALLLSMVAQVTNKEPDELIICFGDTHIYKNHVNQVKEQLDRIPLKLPTLRLNPEIKNIDDFKYEDIKLIDYKAHPHISAKIAV